MNIFPSTDDNIKKAAAIIRSGGVVSFATETVYGLGADAFNPGAVSRIFEIKNRPFFDPLIVHIDRIDRLSLIARDVPEPAMALAERFWPGPLTLVLPKTPAVPHIVTSGLDTVACRIPSHPVALRLIAEAGTPIAAPSANPFGYLSPTRAEHVEIQLGGRVDMILDGGPSPVGVESTIVSLVDEFLLLRPGGVPREEIERIIGPVRISSGDLSRPTAPGQTPYHYSPATPVRIEKEPDPSRKNAGFLLFRGPLDRFPAERTEILSPRGDLREAAANLFTALHRLDKLNLEVIIAEPVEETGLGLAIMDRLKKASQKAGKDGEHGTERYL